MGTSPDCPQTTQVTHHSQSEYLNRLKSCQALQCPAVSCSSEGRPRPKRQILSVKGYFKIIPILGQHFMRISGIWQRLNMFRLDHHATRQGGDHTRSPTWENISLNSPTSHFFHWTPYNSKRYWSFFYSSVMNLWKDVLSHSYSNSLLNSEFVFRCFEMLLRFKNLWSM